LHKNYTEGSSLKRELDGVVVVTKLEFLGVIMLLILNTIMTEEGRQRFDALVREKLFPESKTTIRYLNDKFDDLENFTHLIVSGSSLSAVEGSNWDNKIYSILDHFVSNDKAVLGICYGHHILARYLGGAETVRKSVAVQYGFRLIHIENNPLFAGLTDIFAMEAHGDEVHDLSSDFRVIAKDDDGCIQGYQYQDKRVWGIQFHPEYGYFDGLLSWERRFREHPELKPCFKDSVPSHRVMEQNRILFQNFLKL